MQTVKFLGSILLALSAVATGCGQSTEQSDQRSEHPAEEAAAGTPKLETNTYESIASFALANKKRGTKASPSASKSPSVTNAENPPTTVDGPKDPIMELYERAFKKISEAYATTKDVVVVSVAYSVMDQTGIENCAYVQIQQSKFGEPTVLETLVPAGQAPQCVPSRKKGLGLGTIGFLVKLAGNNFAGGLGIGAVYFDGTNLAGCAAGAVGYASELYNAADGTYGAWCSEVISVPR